MTLTKFIYLAVAIVLSVTVGSSVKAQDRNYSATDSIQTHRAQSVFMEVGGPGLFFSANYDTRFSQRRDGLGGRVGLGLLLTDGIGIVTVPVEVNYLIGGNGKYFEIGLGGTLVSFNSSGSFFSFNDNAVSATTVLGTATIGYRYQPVHGGFNFRAGFTPVFNTTTIVPFGGVSFGYTFK